MFQGSVLASLNGTNWTERSESIPRFARWLGFKRTGPNIEDAARSVINGLIRADKLEKTGSQDLACLTSKHPSFLTEENYLH